MALKDRCCRFRASTVGCSLRRSLASNESSAKLAESCRPCPGLIDRGRCHIETHDEGYIGHFPLRLTQLSRTRLAFQILRKTDDHVEGPWLPC